MVLKITIEQLDEGFLLEDAAGKKCAVSTSMLTTKVKSYFGLTAVKKAKLKEPETLRNVSHDEKAANEFIQSVTKAAETTIVEAFTFREIPPFDWHSVPEQKIGDVLKAHIAGDCIKLSRNGWGTVVWVSMKDLIHLRQHPEDLPAINHLQDNKKALIRRFLKDYDFSQVGIDTPEKKSTADKVLEIALEQIDITGKVNLSRIAKELGITSASVSYHINRLEAQLNAAKQKWQDERDKPMLKTVTRPGEEEKIGDMGEITLIK
jgi:hypothetical protein